ncbi:MAG: hypothetical protein OEO82_14225 [Gammaproteobacteria bacterium]|nr:hypothetical protein [Gammaproteobacteria bacterium]
MGVGKPIQIVAVLLALVAGLVGGFPFSAVLIAVFGVVGGYFIAEEDGLRFLVAALALAMVHGALGPIPGIGEYITAALGGLSRLYNAAAVTVILVRLCNALKP